MAVMFRTNASLIAAATGFKLHVGAFLYNSVGGL
jgi:hypothetical protein